VEGGRRSGNRQERCVLLVLLVLLVLVDVVDANQVVVFFDCFIVILPLVVVVEGKKVRALWRRRVSMQVNVKSGQRMSSRSSSGSSTGSTNSSNGTARGRNSVWLGLWLCLCLCLDCDAAAEVEAEGGDQATVGLAHGMRGGS
jgi:hypothetical protein